MRLEKCKGSRDLSTEEMVRFRFIEQVFRDCCLKWGYEEVRTPTLEYLHLFTSTGTLTPSMLSKVYSFLDWDGWSGQRVVLRPDGTIPVARLYIDSLREKGGARLFYITNIFRFEGTGKEARERWQGGAELMGVSSPLADVELIILALEVLSRMGIKGVELRLSHAGLIRSLLSKLGLSPEEQARIFDQILDGDVEALTKIKSRKPELGRAVTSLLDLKGESPGLVKNLKALFRHSLPELEPHIDDFVSIVDLLETMGHSYQIDITCGRGFEYYTGVILQLFVDEDKVGGGGRYDALIPLMGGGNVPASGFALYFDRLMDIVEPATLPKPTVKGILIKSEPEAIKQGFNIARYLRETGYVAELDLGGEEPTNVRWVLEVRSSTPIFVLTDRTKCRKSELSTVDEVVAVLEEGNADKDSAA